MQRYIQIKSKLQVNLIFLIIIMIFIFSCRQRSNNKLLNYSFDPISKISSELNENIDNMTEVSVSSEHIFVHDYTQTKVFVFDIEGNLVSEFGEKGKGPGEFISLSGMLSGENKVQLFDDTKKTFLTFNAEGKFLMEEKYASMKYPRKGILGKHYRLFSTTEMQPKNKILYKKDNLELENNDGSFMLSTSSSEYNPNLIDLCSEFENRFCFVMNKDENKIVYTNYRDLSYTINIYDTITKKTKVVNKNIGYAKYTTEEVRELKETLADFKETFKNDPKMEFEEIDNKKPVIKSISFNNDQLWVSVSDEDTNSELIHVFDDKFNLIGEVNAQLPDITDMYIRNNYLIIHSRLKQTVSIFKINNA